MQNELDGHPYWFSRIINNYGYAEIKVSPKDKFYCMVNRNGAIREHRYIMAESLGRPLLKSEHVHHKNGIKTDNRIENLELISQANHTLYNKMCSHCELRKEIRLLRWQLNQFMEQGSFNLLESEIVNGK